jgi:hypothetical protein
MEDDIILIEDIHVGPLVPHIQKIEPFYYLKLNLVNLEQPC